MGKRTTGDDPSAISASRADDVGVGLRKHRPFGDTMEDAAPGILALVRTGLSVKSACARAGFTDRAWRYYVERNPDARDAQEQAEGEREAPVELCAYEGAKTDPDLAFKYLERRRPDDWARRDAGVSVNVSQTQVAVDHAALREAQLEVLRALERDPQYLDGLEDGDED